MGGRIQPGSMIDANLFPKVTTSRCAKLAYVEAIGRTGKKLTMMKPILTVVLTLAKDEVRASCFHKKVYGSRVYWLCLGAVAAPGYRAWHSLDRPLLAWRSPRTVPCIAKRTWGRSRSRPLLAWRLETSAVPATSRTWRPTRLPLSLAFPKKLGGWVVPAGPETCLVVSRK